MRLPAPVAVAVLVVAATVLEAATLSAGTASLKSNTAGGPGDVDGLVQLQIQVHASSENRQEPEAASASAPDSVELCFVQDNRCFDQRLEVRHPLAEDVPTEGFAEIVVTRAGEDVRWLDALPEVPAVVYNRGGSPSLLPRARGNLRVIPQANTGREDDEMLRHISNNYDNLPNITIFLQGWPILHCAGVVGTVRNVLRSLREPGGSASLGNGALEGLVPLSRTFYEYSEPDGLIGYARAMVEAHEVGDDLMERSVSLYAKMCRSLLGRPCPESHWVAEGAQWAVSRERIHSRSLDFYQQALELGEGYQGKLRGLVLEAIWPLIWGADGWSPVAPAAGGSPPADSTPTESPLTSPMMDLTPTEMPSAAQDTDAAEPMAMLDIGTAVTKAGLPTEEWCRRWYWTWICEAAGLPAGYSGTRPPRTERLYGSFTKTAVMSQNSHCAASSGNDALIWSCEDRMAFCGLQQHSQLLPGTPSQQMLLQQPRFHAQVGTKRLEMFVHLCAVLLPGARHCLRADSAGDEFTLEEQGKDEHAGTQWYLSEMASAARGNTAGILGGRSITLSTTSSRFFTRFLACNNTSDKAQLVSSRAPWQLIAAPDGLFRLQAVDGRYLQLSAGPPYSLLCSQGERPEYSVFTLQLEAHAPPDMVMQEGA